MIEQKSISLVTVHTMRLQTILFLLLLVIYGYQCGTYKTPIKHFVVLMMENRSFDHMLGHLKQKNSNIIGLIGNESNPVDPNNPFSESVYVSFDAPDTSPDPGHSIADTEEQIYGSVGGSKSRPPLMNGFISNAASRISKEWSKNIMKNFRESTAPVISSLAENFAVFDMWFSSVPGPTQPNRLYLHTCTSDGMGHNDLVRMFFGLPQKSIYQSMEEVGHTWRVYFSEISEVLMLAQMRKAEYIPNYRWFDQFEEDVKKGDLPTLTMIHPNYFSIINGPATDQHPDHAVTEGERFIKFIYETLRASPIWNETAFLITYDEHGGFYDHFPPPVNVPNPDGKNTSINNFDFTRLGVRVPTILISPWVNRRVIHEPINGAYYDHSSVHATLKKMFGLNNYLTKRDLYAGSFEFLLNERSTPRTDCPVKLPEVPDHYKIEKAIPEHLQPLNSLQKSLIIIAEGLTNTTYSMANEIQTEHEGALYVKHLVKKFLYQ